MNKYVINYSKYLIFCDGRVYSFWRNKFLKPGKDKGGYLHVVLVNDFKVKRTTKVHRLVAGHYILNPNNLPYVNHIDGNKLNNNYLNLEWLSPTDSARHAVRTGLWKFGKGSKSRRHKLNEEDVLKIRDLYNKGFTQIEIGKLFKVRQTTISGITTKKTWN